MSLPGDWECTYCSWTNVASVRRCDDCDAPAPAPSPVALTQLPPNPAKAEESPPSSPPPPAPDTEESPHKPSAPSSSSPQLSPPPEQEPAYLLDPRYSRTDFGWSARLAEENERVFGATPLRPEQEQAVNAALDNRDVLVVLPTGFGKSRCYQIPALLEEGLTVVVVPLLSLMTDQWHALNAAGIPAQYMNSNQTKDETSQACHAPPHRATPTSLGPAAPFADPSLAQRSTLAHQGAPRHARAADSQRGAAECHAPTARRPHAAAFRHRRGALVRSSRPPFSSAGGARPPSLSPAPCPPRTPCTPPAARPAHMRGVAPAWPQCDRVGKGLPP